MAVGSETELHQRLPARAESVPLLRRSVDRFAAGGGASDGRLAAIALAVTEAVSNAVVHAYVDRDEPGLVDLDVRLRDRTLQVTVCDDGVGMRPRVDSPGAGLGLGLIASVSDDFALTERRPGVCVRMTFVLD
jgi:serine/threonine-protein kinase RsbW